MLRDQKPDLVFLCETYCTVMQAKYVFRFSSFSNFAGSDVVGHRGGMLLMWNNTLNIQVMDVTPHWLHCCITDNTGQQVEATFVYGHPKLKYRYVLWDFLRNIAPSINRSWIVAGGFNQVLEAKDKLSKCTKLEGVVEFQKVVFDCAFIDLIPSGNWFSWSNNREGIDAVWERLDRTFVNSTWVSTFPRTSVFCLPVIKSDHSPLLISTCNEIPRRSRPMKFEAMWLVGNACSTVVENAWNEKFMGSYAYVLAQKIRHTMVKLIEWNRKEFGHVPTKVKELTEQVQKLQTELHNLQNQSNEAMEIVAQEKEVRLQLNEWLDKEELMRAQRSKQMWLINGDRNTKYFHILARTRKARNHVDRIRGQNGVWIESYDEIEKAAGVFFENIYKLESEAMNMNNILDQVCLPFVSNNIKHMLSQGVQRGEIKNAFFQMSPYKSPGYDGLPAGFYHHFWKLVEHDVVNMIQQVFNSGFLLKQLNHTLITLILKIECPSTFKEFRPISLCNVAYKAISKILVLRMQDAMKELISPHQNAFIKGRLISDSIFITTEMMDFIHKAKNKKTFWCAIKIDFYKAYDRIRWEFLEDTLRKMNFSHHFIKIIMQCVTTVKYSLLLNGQKACNFNPQRGLLQGDPLSPYLFICCMNVLSVMLHQVEEAKQIQGIQFNRSGPMVSHVMYVDDLILCFKEDFDSCRVMADLLHSFCTIAGLEVNTDKSFAVFSPNTPNELKDEMAGMFKLKWADRIGKYLGTYINEHKDKNRNFQVLIDKLSSRLAGWKSKILSQAGRLTLIHSTLSADMIYPMSSIQFTVQQNNEINRIINNFFWGDSDQRRAPHLLQARVLKLPRKMGGVGIKDAHIVNKALLAKASWRIIHDRNTLLSKWAVHKYFQDTTQWLPRKCVQSSVVWKSIVANLPIITNGLKWQVGNGSSIDMSSRFWVAPLTSAKGITVAAGLINHTGDNWDISKITNHYSQDMVQVLQALSLSKLGTPDTLVWSQNRKGVYNSSDGYKLLAQVDSNHSHQNMRFAEFPWNDFWKAKLPH